MYGCTTGCAQTKTLQQRTEINGMTPPALLYRRYLFPSQQCEAIHVKTCENGNMKNQVCASMEGLRLGAPLAQTGRVMGMRNPQGPPIDPPGSLMYIYVALACLLVLARSPAILVTAFSSRSRRLVRRPCLPIPPRPHARPGALDSATIPLRAQLSLCSLRLYRDPGI